MAMMWFVGALVLQVILFSSAQVVYNRLDGVDPFHGNSFLQHHHQFLSGHSFHGFTSPAANSEEEDPAALGCGTAPTYCPDTPYRSYDGSCNNLKNPVWGTPNTPYNRLLPPNYGDGVSLPTMSRTGHPLPSARLVSLHIYPDIPINEPHFTINIMSYGQIITHDMSMIAGSTQTHSYQRRCCSDDGQLLELANLPEHCYPIVLPPDDPIYQHTNRQCMNFARTITNRDRRCVDGSTPAEQLTAVNHFLDLSLTYGNNDKDAQKLRQFQGGRLRSEIRHGQEWPPRATNASGTCRLQKEEDACYMAGDGRANQNPQLTLLQVVYLREHNRIVDVLAKLNPHWDDEKLFQEARKINIAEHQYISYYEWLPLFLGLDTCIKNKLVWNTDGYVNDYDEHINPTVLNEQSSTAFRHFHSLIAGRLDLTREDRSSYGHIRLTDFIDRPQILEDDDKFDELSRGLNTQPSHGMDEYHDSAVTQFLFREDNETFGIDLKAFDIQRNRDHGIASYNTFRESWGIPRAHSFSDFLDIISEESVQKLASLYQHPDDVELIVGGSLEKIIDGALVGPSFLRILTEQFYRSRVGDRFWFENEGKLGFTLEQLKEIKKSSISRLMCDNGHKIETMQPKGFVKISHNNPLVPCYTLPSVNLELWQEQQSTGSTIWDPFGVRNYFYHKK